MRSLGRETTATALAAVLLLAGCTGTEPPAGAPPAAPAPSDAPPPGSDESLRDEALALVEAREQALQRGDRRAFLATVDPDALTFTATQARWFDNLAQLPLTDVSLELGDEDDMSRVHGEGALQLPVDVTMRLDGFDRRPVTQPQVYTFNRVDGEVVLSNDRNIQSDAQHDWLPAPWDITRIEVRRSGPVLGIFDEDTVPYADTVMTDLVAAREEIRDFIPTWSGRFVAYDITDLQAMAEMSQMETWDTGGVAFPVLERPGSRRVASYRFMVNPDVADSPLQRGFLFRHELVHVALGGIDAHSPTWLREGIAEYVSRSPLPAETRRRISATTLAGIDPATAALASGVDFYRSNPTLNYELANLVCDHLATTRGPQVLFDLMAGFAEARPETAADAEVVVRRELGTGTRGLLQAALAWGGVG